jgi:dsRNA-specific ribonuclease
MTTSREYTNIYNRKVVEYISDGKVVGKGSGPSYEKAENAAKADIQVRQNKK